MPKRNRERPSTLVPEEEYSEFSGGEEATSEASEDDSSEVDSLDSVLMTSRVPRDAKIVALLLKSLGVENVGARVVPQFLEIMHNYVSEILREACTYARHQQSSVKRKSKKSKKHNVDPPSPARITLEDVRLATQARVHYSFIQPPPRELMLELSSSRNRIPLPLVPTGTSVRLPPEEQRVRAHAWKSELAKETMLSRERREFDCIEDRIGRPPLPPPSGSTSLADETPLNDTEVAKETTN